MFAGKTTWLLERARALSPEEFVLLKPSIDTRYSDNECVTHDGDRLPAFNLPMEPLAFPDFPSKIKTVLLDELNFLNPEALIPAVEAQLAEGRDVIAAGLMYDFEKKPFGATLPLSKIADEFVQLEARCDGCNQPARQSYRKVQVADQVVLGAEELYGACCDGCWARLSAAAARETESAMSGAVAESTVTA